MALYIINAENKVSIFFMGISSYFVEAKSAPIKFVQSWWRPNVSSEITSEQKIQQLCVRHQLLTQLDKVLNTFISLNSNIHNCFPLEEPESQTLEMWSGELWLISFMGGLQLCGFVKRQTSMLLINCFLSRAVRCGWQMSLVKTDWDLFQSTDWLWNTKINKLRSECFDKAASCLYKKINLFSFSIFTKQNNHPTCRPQIKSYNPRIEANHSCQLLFMTSLDFTIMFISKIISIWLEKFNKLQNLKLTIKLSIDLNP